MSNPPTFGFCAYCPGFVPLGRLTVPRITIDVNQARVVAEVQCPKCLRYWKLENNDKKAEVIRPCAWDKTEDPAGERLPWMPEQEALECAKKEMRFALLELAEVPILKARNFFQGILDTITDAKVWKP